MRILIAGGTGFIGQALTKRFLKTECHITILGRSKAKIQRLYTNTVKALDWPQFDKQSADILNNIDVVINLCGTNIGARRWTTERKQQIIDSRIIPTEKLATACAAMGNKAPRLISASAIGVYGLQKQNGAALPPALDENTDTSGNPSDFLSRVARAWEGALNIAEDAGVNVVKTRFAVVLDKNGGALPMIAKPFYFGMGGRIGTGHQPFSWIALNDLCRAMEFIIDRPDILGQINLVSLKCVSQCELAHAIGRALHRPSVVPTPALALKILFGQMAEELLLEGQHVVPMRLSYLGFEFKYPDLDSALQAIYT